MTQERHIPQISDCPEAREFYRGRRVLVTGASGFLGSNCLGALNALGAEITAVTRSSDSGGLEAASHVIIGDLLDPDIVERALVDQEVVFNLTGVSGAVDTNRRPAESVAADCVAQVQITHRCAQSAIKPFVVFCSTRLVYGNPQYLPVDETHPLKPDSIYAVNKLADERYLDLYGRIDNLPWCVFRLSNPFGPHPKSYSRGYGVINHFIRQAARGDSITVYGAGSQRRDYIYVDDVVRVFLLAPMNPRCAGEIFNLGGPASISIATAVEIISRLAGGCPVDFVPWPAEYAKVETGDYESDLSKLGTFIEIGAQASFEEGVKHTLDWCRREHVARSKSEQRCV